nr:hypothetical protein [Mycoplasmopsis bovis]
MIQLEVKYKERIDKYISDNSEITRNDAKGFNWARSCLYWR